MRTKSQNGRRSRSKGAAFERWVAAELRRYGVPAERNIAQARTAAREGCDVEDSRWWIECKVGARIDVRGAYLQALHDRDERPIVVVHKRDRCEVQATIEIRQVLVTMRFVDWIERWACERDDLSLDRDTVEEQLAALEGWRTKP
jgi:hypothetical protein